MWTNVKKETLFFGKYIDMIFFTYIRIRISCD